MSEQKTKIDLSLVPIGELLAEAKTRCDTFIYAYDLPDEKLFYTARHSGRWDDRVFLARILDHLIVKSGFEEPD